MNKILKTAAFAALVSASPLAMAGTASAQTRHDVREQRQDVRDARQNVQQQRRDVRQAQRWNQRSHNGYYLGTRFYYGQPNYAQTQRRDYRPAYQQWRRGDRLPSYGRAQYREVDYRREHLRAPPRGYHYVRDDRGEVLLVGIATGVILSILLSQ
jgi:Ni/Co efflux regulator RcnB